MSDLVNAYKHIPSEITTEDHLADHSVVTVKVKVYVNVCDSDTNNMNIYKIVIQRNILFSESYEYSYRNMLDNIMADPEHLKHSHDAREWKENETTDQQIIDEMCNTLYEAY